MSLIHNIVAAGILFASTAGAYAQGTRVQESGLQKQINSSSRGSSVIQHVVPTGPFLPSAGASAHDSSTNAVVNDASEYAPPRDADIVTDPVLLKPFSQAYKIKAAGFLKLNGTHPTAFEYTPILDLLHTGDEKIVGFIEGTAEISLNLGVTSIYDHIQMRTYINKNGYPLQSITLFRSDPDEYAVSDPADLEIIAKEGFVQTRDNYVTSVFNELFIPIPGDTAYRKVINPKKGTEERVPARTHDLLSYIFHTINHPQAGNLEAQIHYYGITQRLPVRIIKGKDKQTKEDYFYFGAEIPESMLKDISSVQFKFKQGEPPFFMKAYPSAVSIPITAEPARKK